MRKQPKPVLARALAAQGYAPDAIATKLGLPPSHVERMLGRGERGRPAKGGAVVRVRVPDAGVEAAERERVSVREWAEGAIRAALKG